MSVDNRYTGVGYEPPFETPSDKDFMAAHIEELESRVRELEADEEFHICKNNEYVEQIKNLEAELAKCQQVATPIGFGEILQSALDERDNLRARHAALVEKYNELLDV